MGKFWIPSTYFLLQLDTVPGAVAEVPYPIMASYSDQYRPGTGIVTVTNVLRFCSRFSVMVFVCFGDLIY